MQKNVLYGIRCYLIGSMQYADGQDWRTDVKTKLSQRGIIFFDPYHKPFINDIPEDQEARKQLLKWQQEGRYHLVQDHMWDVRGCDLRLVDISDFFIVNIIPHVASWGSAEEVSTLCRQKKPVFICIEGGKVKCPLWLMGMFKHTYFYDSMEEVVNTIIAIDDGIIKTNSDRWRLLRNEFRSPEQYLEWIKNGGNGMPPSSLKD